ncbi:hypothetical protein N0V87_002973 [Didymella glomerata]|uniref:Uncharacterized protein n=1 Tax=Didymella glomerata TaxID=749621 RepID=A0A9W8X384_9PLEO|nr:hypothetical protein N0V87_002973 [Didymella glomerata]
MPHHSRIPIATSIPYRDQVFKLDTANVISQDHDFNGTPSDDAQTDDEHLQKLKELFEQNAGLITPGCRDTIDSILSSTVQFAMKSSKIHESVSLSDEGSAAPEGDSDGYITQDTETTWDDQEHTHLDIYADLDTGLFQDRAGVDRRVAEDEGANAPKETALVLEERQGQFSRSSALAMSPIIQVAAFIPQAVASINQPAVDGPAASSGNKHDLPQSPAPTSAMGKACIAGPSVRTGHTGFGSALERASDLHDLNESAERGRPCTRSLMPEDSASNIVVSTKHQEGSYKRPNKPIEQPILGYDADDLLGYSSKRVQSDVEEWLEHVGDAGRLSAAGEGHEEQEVSSSYFAWIEQDGAAEHVLDAGMAIAFAVVAVTGHVLW